MRGYSLPVCVRENSAIDVRLFVSRPKGGRFGMMRDHVLVNVTALSTSEGKTTRELDCAILVALCVSRSHHLQSLDVLWGRK